METEMENEYILPDNLFLLIFDFLPAEDIPSIALCSQKFNNLVKNLDYKYKFFFEEKFCSSFSNFE